MRWLGLALSLPWLASCAVFADVEGADAGRSGSDVVHQCQTDDDCGSAKFCARSDEQGNECLWRHCDGFENPAEVCGPGCACDVGSRTCRCPAFCGLGEDDPCPDGEHCLTRDGLALCVAEEDLPRASSCEAWPAVVHVREGGSATVALLGVDEQGGPVSFGSCSLVVTAEVSACDEEPCASAVSSTCAGAPCVVERRVYGALPASAVRVVVVEEGSGAPLEGARVVVRAGAMAHEAETDARGVASFDEVGALESVTVMPAAHEWHTLIGDARDVLVSTRVRRSAALVAGAIAQGDFSEATSFGDVKLMAAGVSLDDLTALSVRSLLGEEETRDLVLDGVTDADGAPMSLPSGMGFEIAAEPVKGTALLLGAPGRRLPWALGARVRLSQLGNLITAAGGVLPPAVELVGLMFPRADHAVGHTVVLEERPRGATLFPYDEVASDTLAGEDALALETLTSGRLEVVAPRLPCPPASPACASSETEPRLLLAVLADVSGRGHLPLGMAVAHDVPPDVPPEGEGGTPDGVVDVIALEQPLPPGEVRLTFAPPHEGLEGVALSVAALSLGPEVAGTASVTGVMTSVDEGADRASFGRELLPYPRGGVAGATVSVDDVGADLTRITLRSADVTWHVWTSGSASTIALPSLLPDGLAAPAGDLALTALVVEGEASPASLFDLGSGGALALERDLRAWATVGCGEGSSCFVE